ncbi:MAG TPA: FAD-binding oxidoreductase, partial [Candidatus Dormibacteraeota bacterium]|nr:FAD-binding oxidoreductase [Candidatus Dormibacteraeota bacterium]
MSVELLTGWGRTAPTAARVLHPDDAEELTDLFKSAPARGVIARGLGRSYGDAAQNAGGVVVDSDHIAALRDIDLRTGEATVDAGMSLDRMMRLLVPLGWFPPVTPGTRHVTVGGAIAADIHGKNHHIAGSFSQHVRWLDLLTADGRVRRVSPESDADLFWATAGGMGLTGVILRARVQLKAIESSRTLVDTDRTPDLDSLMTLLSETDHLYDYSVAWIDCVAKGKRMGRSVVTRGRFAKLDELPAKRRTDP